MNNEIIKNIVRFILLLIAQIFVFNKINLGGYFNPYVYLMFIVLLPFETPRWLLLLSSFSLGFLVDIFTGSLGMNAATATFVAFLRPSISSLLLPKRDKDSVILPGINFMGLPTFTLYTALIVFIHHFLLFFLESFRLSELGNIIFRVILSSFLTTLLIVILEMIFTSTKKR